MPFSVVHDRGQQPAAGPALSPTSDLLVITQPDGSNAQLVVRACTALASSMADNSGASVPGIPLKFERAAAVVAIA